MIGTTREAGLVNSRQPNDDAQSRTRTDEEIEMFDDAAEMAAVGHGESCSVVSVPPTRRAALDAWLSKADAVLSEQRAHSISPSFVDAVVANELYEAILPLAALEDALAPMLDRLVADPGRWILILSVGPPTAHYYVQFLVFEDGSLLAEAVANDHIGVRYRRKGADSLRDGRLRDLGWEAPTPGDGPNWTAIEATISPDVAAIATLGIRTLRSVFGATDDDPVRANMFSSSRRGDTPAADLATGEVAAKA